MNTADWALLISLCSLAVSFAAFIWNVWSKFIYPKAKVRVYIGIFRTFLPGVGAGAEFVNMGATNLGPGEITLTHAVIHTPKIWPFQKRMDGLLVLMVTDPENPSPQFDPFGYGILPKKLEVGGQMSVRMSMSTNMFDGTGWGTRVGFTDSFGRNHWASRKVTKKLRKDLAERVIAKRDLAAQQ